MPLDPYYARKECSNSDLSDLNKILHPEIYDLDFSEALRFGTLVDAYITEMSKINIYKRSVEEYIYKPEEMELAKRMKMAFYKDPTCAAFMKLADCQKVSSGMVEYNWCNVKFMLEMRAKWDLFMRSIKMGADIKSTTAKTQKQFEDACEHFHYYRSRVVYMKLENTEKDMLIGISKTNCKIFKVPIQKGDKYWQKGLADASELAFHYWFYFDGFKPNIPTIL